MSKHVGEPSRWNEKNIPTGLKETEKKFKDITMKSEVQTNETKTSGTSDDSDDGARRKQEEKPKGIKKETQKNVRKKDGSPCKEKMKEHKEDDSDDGGVGPLAVAVEQLAVAEGPQEETTKVIKKETPKNVKKKDDSDDRAGGKQEEKPKTKTKFKKEEMIDLSDIIVKEVNWEKVEKEMEKKQHSRSSTQLKNKFIKQMMK